MEPRDHRAALIAFGSGTPAYRLAEIAAWGSVRRAACCSSPCSCPRCSACSTGSGPGSLAARRRCARGAAQLRAGVRGPRRGADQRLRGHRAREPAADRRGGGALLRAGALHAAGEPVRDVGLGGGAAGDVERDRQRERAGSATCAAGSTAGLRQIAFFVVPSAMAFLALGDVVAGALYQSGAFTRAMTVYVWAILAGSAVGLLASTMGRLYSSTYYALHDTRTPLRYRRAPGRPDDRPGLPLRAAAAESARARAAMGRRGAHRLRRDRGVGRVPAAPARAQRADRRGPACRSLTPRRLWGAAGVGAAGAWALRAVLPCRGIRWWRRSRCSASFGAGLSRPDGGDGSGRVVPTGGSAWASAAAASRSRPRPLNFSHV